MSSTDEVAAITPTINTDKIGALSGDSGPEWADFRGISLLMEGPASRIRSGRGLSRLSADSGAPLYRALRLALSEIPSRTWAERYRLALIPPEALHVTAFDGINAGNLGDVLPAHRADARRYLGGLPATLRETPAWTWHLTESELARRTWNLSFGVRDLVVWGESVMAARLQPTTEAKADVEAFCAARRDLVASFAERFGPEPRVPFEPHVTLGYFADPYGARRTQPMLPALSQAVRAMGEATYRAHRVALYGFTDMATFVRAR